MASIHLNAQIYGLLMSSKALLQVRICNSRKWRQVRYLQTVLLRVDSAARVFYVAGLLSGAAGAVFLYFVGLSQVGPFQGSLIKSIFQGSQGRQPQDPCLSMLQSILQVVAVGTAGSALPLVWPAVRAFSCCCRALSVSSPPPSNRSASPNRETVSAGLQLKSKSSISGSPRNHRTR